MSGLTVEPGVAISEQLKSELLARYKRLRAVSTNLNNTLVGTLPKDVLREGAKKLGLLQGDIFVFDSEDETSVLMDYCIYEIRRKGRNALEQCLIDSPPAEDSDEMAVLRTMQNTVYSIFEIESIVPGLGITVRDVVSNDSCLIIDIGLAKSGQVGLLMATRLNPYEGFFMTGGAGIPIGLLPKNQREQFLKALIILLNSRTGTDPATLIRSLLSRGVSDRVRYEDPFETSGPAISTQAQSAKRIGRNETCPCGSGKKFKHCCLPRG